MKTFITLSIVLFAQAGLSANIYKYLGDRTQITAASTEIEFSGGKIIDSIPQLGIYVTETPIQLYSDDFQDLGEMQNISFFEPRTENNSLPWGHKAIHASEAWKLSTGAGVVVAVSDTGVDSDHPDLAGSMWKNSGETGFDQNGKDRGSNGIDDDNNGYIDDVFGWDFVKKNPSGKDHHYHGTHVAGTISAQPSKKFSGVAPGAKIMDVSFISSGGTGTEVNGAKSIVYAADNGANIINCSWGGPGKNQIIEDAILYAQNKGVLLVVAAGNSTTNTDKKAFTPASADYDNVVAVGASTKLNGKASFSNFGANSVDLAAPGLNIFSTSPSSNKKSTYRTLSGTSMASPHTAGVAALVWSANPKFNWQQVKVRLLETVQSAKKWKKKSITGGILDAHAAVKK